MTISEAEYKTNLDLLVSAAHTLQLVDIQACRDFIGKAEALAPILEPTAYLRGGSKNLSDQRRFLDAAAAFRRVIEDIQPAAAAASSGGSR